MTEEEARALLAKKAGAGKTLGRSKILGKEKKRLRVKGKAKRKETEVHFSILDKEQGRMKSKSTGNHQKRQKMTRKKSQ